MCLLLIERGDILKNNSIQITVKVKPNIDEELKRLSAKTNRPVAELVREFIDKGLNINGYKNETDFIREQIREELKSILLPNIERLIKIIVKSGITSASSFFLTGKVLSELVAPSRQLELKEILEEAKKLGIAYIQAKDSDLSKLSK